MSQSRHTGWSVADLMAAPSRPAQPAARDLPVRVALPDGYEPNYPYPVLILFHESGGSERQVLQLVPKISRRNYICVSVRGPEPLGVQETGRSGYGWGETGEYDGFVEDYLMRSLLQVRRRYHVHSERVYLTGLCEGASVAYRLGLRCPDTWGGVVSLNGSVPDPRVCGPLLGPGGARGFRVFQGHGIANALCPFATAERDFRLLYAMGAEVRLESYPTNHGLHPQMLRDVDRWIMDHINGQNDRLLIDQFSR